VLTSCPAAPYGAKSAGPGSGKTVALTFDDGPGASTASILSILARYGVPATFFNVGQNMAAQPSPVKQEASMGYALDNHTWSHPRSTRSATGSTGTGSTSTPGRSSSAGAAARADPATHFIRLSGSHAGAYRFEYAPNGSASWFCVSDPAGGWASDPLRDGLILTSCDTGPWQQFVPQPNGTLKNVATGLYVSPNGTGAQLRGTAAPSPWGAPSTPGRDYAHLPR
jgi:hypothetical protein